MSRIHEALKKAAQDRSRSSGAGVSFDLVEVPAGIRRPAPVEQDSSTSQGSLIESPQFEEFKRRSAHRRWNLDPRGSVFLDAKIQKIGAERFRTLRSRLYQIAESRTLKRVMVTSSVPSEGKSFICANLAQSLVHKQNRRVLLIDADLRASSLHQLFGTSKSPGLSDYLRGEADEFQVTQCGMEGNLFLIPGGSEASNPSELLLSDRMKKLLEMMSGLFDWIILDTPPVLPVHDSSLLADQCDGVLFVVRAGSTDFELAAKASAEFREKNLLGVVLNHSEAGKQYGEPYYG
jgi:protein-tyrosine kinase